MAFPKKTEAKHELRVFYDGQCVVCSKEIELYMRKDTSHKIEFVDIAGPSFDANKEGVDPNEVQTVFHVKDAKGEWHKGVDGFVAIWNTLDIFAPLSLLAKSPLSRPLLDLGYSAFTKIRPYLPRKECHDGSCRI